MANFYDKTRVYLFSYYQEKLQTKPFFLGVNDITAEAAEGEPWTLSSNPIFCEVYKDATLDELIIFLLHICHYNNDKENEEIGKLFDQFIIVFKKILERILSEFDTEKQFEFDDIMAMFNLLNIISDMLFKISKCLSNITMICMKNFDSTISDMFFIIGRIICKSVMIYTRISEVIGIIDSSCCNVKFNIIRVRQILKNGYLSSHETKIVTHSEYATFKDDSGVSNVTDYFFNKDIKNIKIYENNVIVESIKNSLSFNTLKMEEILPNAKWEKKKFQIVNGSTILSEKNLDNMEYLMKLGDNPGKLNVKYCREILDIFNVSFWKRKEIRENRNFKLMTTEEIQFIFQFMILVLNLLKEAENGIELKNFIVAALFQFGNILNGLRFKEFDTICIETSMILSKSLMELLSDPLVKTYLKEISSTLIVVLIRVNIYLSKDRNMASVSFVEYTDDYSLPQRDVTPISSISNIFKSRRSKWRNLLGEHATAESFLDYNDGECPTCYDELQAKGYNLLLCKHTLCQYCLERILEPDARKLCPVCRTPVGEYLPSSRIGTVCSALQLLALC